MPVLSRKPGGGGGSSGGVTSVAKSGDTALTGAVTLSEGSNVTLTQVGQDIEVAAAGGGGVPDIIVVSRSSNTILDLSNKGELINATAAFTQTFDAAATLGAGWWVDIHNATTDGSSVLVLDPTGGELIDGATTLHMWSGEIRRVISTGSAFVTIMLNQGLGLYAQTTSTLSSYSSTEAGSTDWLTLGAQTYDAVPIFLEVNAQFSIAGFALIITLWDGATELCRFDDQRATSRGAASIQLTPTAGSHTYKMSVFGNSGNSLDSNTGAAGAGTYPPAWMRAVKV